MIINNKELTLEKAIQIYLKWKGTHATTASKPYETRLKQFRTFILQTKPTELISKIDGDDIVAFQQYMQLEYSDATIAYSSRILRNFFDFFRGRGLSHLNPKEIRSIRFVSKTKDPVQEEDVDAMLAQLDDSYIEDLQKGLVIRLLWDTGMRISELLSLKIEDLNEQDYNGYWTAHLKTKKAFRYNLVVWGRKTNEKLTKYLAWRLSVDAKSDYLFIPTAARYDNGSSVSSRTVQRWMRSLSSQANLPRHITPHSFRHGRAHYILNNQGTAVDVQAMLRHKNLNSSLSYMQLNPSQYLATASKYLNLPTKGLNPHLGMKVIGVNSLS